MRDALRESLAATDDQSHLVAVIVLKGGVGAAMSVIPKTAICKPQAWFEMTKIRKSSISDKVGIPLRAEIEKCSANPSIATLCKIAAALGLSVADVVNVADTPAAHVIKSQDMPTLWTGPLGGSAKLLARTSGPNMIELWRWELYPGETFASSGHPHGTTQLFHVEAGTLHFRLGDTELIVTKGCAAVAKTGVPHAYSNNGKSKLVFTMSVTELHRHA